MVSPRTPRFRATIDAGTFTAQIPISELTARPTEAYVPRFRASALFGRVPERVVRLSLPASENLHMSRPALDGCEMRRAPVVHRVRSYQTRGNPLGSSSEFSWSEMAAIDSALTMTVWAYGG